MTPFYQALISRLKIYNVTHFWSHGRVKSSPLPSAGRSSVTISAPRSSVAVNGAFSRRILQQLSRAPCNRSPSSPISRGEPSIGGCPAWRHPVHARVVGDIDRSHGFTATPLRRANTCGSSPSRCRRQPRGQQLIGRSPRLVAAELAAHRQGYGCRARCLHACRKPSRGRHRTRGSRPSGTAGGRRRRAQGRGSGPLMPDHSAGVNGILGTGQQWSASSSVTRLFGGARR